MATLLVHPGVSIKDSIPLVDVGGGLVVVPAGVVVVVFTDVEAGGVEFETGGVAVVGGVVVGGVVTGVVLDAAVVLDVSALLQADDSAREARAVPPMTMPAPFKNSLRDNFRGSSLSTL